MVSPKRYALCIQNRGYKASLDVRKVYPVLPDATATRRGLLRVVDESGEDYLYPAELFVPIEVPRAAAKAFVSRSA
jgi:hypothetical protein